MNFDLRVYKPATIERRVVRRLALSGFDDVDAYLEHLRQAPSEQQTLVRDLLISVTEFFRDPAAFAALRTTVIEPLVAQAEPGATLRAWVPGCATVLEDFSVRSRELRTKDGRWISRQVLPYRTENRHIEGVVVTFVDVTALKSATERLELRERQQSTIAQLGLLALRETDIQGFFDRVVGNVQRALDADFAKILELQPRQDELLLRAGVGWQEGQVGVAVEPSGAGSPAGYALQSQAPVIIDDVAAERRFAIPALLEAHGVASGISCAVRDGDHRYGVIGAYTKSRHRFTTEDEHFLQAVANVVGSAIGRHQNRMRLALELAVAQVLADANELDETLGLLLERMARTMGSVLVAELWWPKGDKLSRRQLHVAPHVDRRRVERDFSPAFRAPGEGVVGRVHEEQHALWITGLANAQVFMRSEGAKALGLSSGLALPASSRSSCRTSSRSSASPVRTWPGPRAAWGWGWPSPGCSSSSTTGAWKPEATARVRALNSW